uniref:G-protein coupled receptors family 3 profile domain-containing protein n=1 Tax=Leptobrachium leishanense TaxID=445787 RepID=A0A8C5QFD0_9ANUR
MHFPTSYRTVPNEIVQYKAIVDLIKHFGWSWVGILASDNESGLQVSQYLHRELSKEKSCVAFLELIPYRDILDEKRRTRIVQSLRDPSINVFIVYGDREYMLTLQIILYMFPIPGKVWIISTQWDVSAGFDYFFLNFFPFNGSLALSMRDNHIPGFQDFILGLNPDMYPNDIFLPYIWFEFFYCNIEIHPNDTMRCTGNERVENSSVPEFYKIFSPYSYSVYTAVFAVAHALHNMYLHKGITREDYMKNINFTNGAGENVHFDENGDISTGFDIISWICCLFYELPIKLCVILPVYIVKQIPMSRCSEICAPGFRKSARQGALSCCYDCIPCPDGEIANMDSCTKCPEDQWHNAKRNMCVHKVVTYLSYGEPLGMSLAFISFLLFLLSGFILALFIKKKDTPIVKANNRDLSFILLLSLKMCFLCSLIFIGHPLRVTCILRQTVFGISFSVSVSSILAKTVTVVIAFKAVKPGSRLRKFLGNKFSNSVVLFCSLLQIVICVTWLGTSPPFPRYNMEDEVGKIVAECNEGSLLGFYIVLGYLGFLAFVSFLIAFLARNLPDAFNEAKYITFSMLVFCSVWISFIPAYLSSKGKYVVAVEIFAILASSSGLLFCIFIPKCYVILRKPETSTKSL